MSEQQTNGWVPSTVREFLESLGFDLPLSAMEGFIAEWDDRMAARGDFWDYHDRDCLGRRYAVHRRSIRPAMRVCREWASLLLNEKVEVACDDQACTEWLNAHFSETGFWAASQAMVEKAFGLGTGAWALWLDLDKREVRARCFDARMIVPLTWDEDGVSECAFVTRVFWRGKAVDQLQMHLKGELPEGLLDLIGVDQPEAFLGNAFIGQDYEPLSDTPCSGTYRIVTVLFDAEGGRVEPEGLAGVVDTGCTVPTFSIVRPAGANTRVDLSPYGQSVFADAVDALEAVDLTFDALVNEVDVAKMRVFLSDVMFDREHTGGKDVVIPFGKQDCTVFRKVMSTDDTIQEFAPALRTDAQVEAFRLSLQVLGDLCGFGLTYFDFDPTGQPRTATEVSSDNSALMRNVRKHENGLERSIAQLCHGLLGCARLLGEKLPPEGAVRVLFDDSIISDTAAEKAQDLSELGRTLNPWEYRAKWYGEDEDTAKRLAAELAGSSAKGFSAED